MNGQGTMLFPDGSRYDGEFKDGRMEGQGIRQYKNFDRYVGGFKNDQFHGTGVWYSAEGATKRQGEWGNGKRLSWLT